MYHFIYKTTNLINHKYYIGMHSTNDINDNYLGSGATLHKAIKKYGKANFSREILEFANSREECFRLEACYITLVQTSDPMCYNIQTGGLGNTVYTDEHKKKISEKVRANFLKTGRGNRKGKPMTDDQKLAQSILFSDGRFRGAANQGSKPIIVTDLATGISKEFGLIKSACEYYGIKQSTVSNAIKLRGGIITTRQLKVNLLERGIS